MHRRIPAAALFVFLWLAGCSHAPTSPSATPGPGEVDPLKHLNTTFRDDYAWQRDETLHAKAEPWLWLGGDQLILHANGKRYEALGIPARYHVLKAISHVPLAVYVLLGTDVDHPIGTEALRRVSDFRGEVAALKNHLGEYPLTDKERSRARRLLEESDSFLEHAVHKQQIEEEELHLFARRQRQPVMANAVAAARAQLETIDAQARKWREFLGPRQWGRLTVVISGPAPARTRNLAVQYFARLLHDKGEGKRILYAEGIFSEPGAQTFLGTHLLDSGIGEAFFDDERRMHRDLLSDAAAEVLRDFDFER